MSRKPREAFTLLDAMGDPHLFARHFRNAETWAAWRAFLAALFALPMTPDEQAIYRECTGRSAAPETPLSEAWLVIGRRGGKSFILALIAVFLACFKDWRKHLGPGERATVMIVAQDRKQSRVIMRFIKGLITEVPMLRRLIEGETQESLDLRNRVTIEIHVASFRSTRGYSVVAALLDELAFWSTDEGSAEPDTEVIAAIKPGMATIPGAMLLCASSPYARRGALHDAYRKHFGRDGDPVWQAPTRTMNPTVPESYIAAAVEEDPISAAAEYGAQFRSDVSAFILKEAVMACVSAGTYERPPERGITYTGFVDPSAGSADSFTLCIGHFIYDTQSVVVDAIREQKPPFDPDQTVAKFSALLKSYGIDRITGDRFAGIWPVTTFAKSGIHYEQNARPKSDLYVDLLPLINAKRIELLDNERLVNQLVGLERRVARSGKDSIDHAPDGHDDVANCVAALASISTQYGGYDVNYRGWNNPNSGPSAAVQAIRWLALANGIVT